jgi:predicted N-acetyltransferase YhbS
LMKETYVIRCSKPPHCAIADLIPLDPTLMGEDVWQENAYLLTRINVPPAYRGQKYGRMLLTKILRDANRSHATIVILQINPSGGLGYKQLEAWYKRHGFVWQPAREGKIMVRKPKE